MSKDGIKLRGFFRLRIGEEDKSGKTKVVGCSGWIKNQIVNLGWQDYILASIGSVTGSKYVKRMILGTGAAPASNDTGLAGETTRSTDINAVTVGSFTLRFTTQWTSGLHPGGTPNIANAALINNTATGGTILCGNAFGSSTWNSNQAVSATYELQKA
ncbi:MAG: hypothetical protein ACYS1A_18225 [Planctomycetota bacterium]|jgi:hypothetical protein